MGAASTGEFEGGDETFTGTQVEEGARKGGAEREAQKCRERAERGDGGNEKREEGALLLGMRHAPHHRGNREMMKEPTWGVKAAYGRVTPHMGSFYSSYRHISRFRKI